MMSTSYLQNCLISEYIIINHLPNYKELHEVRVESFSLHHSRMEIMLH